MHVVWLKRLIILALVSGLLLWIAIHFEVLELTMDGIRVLHEDDMLDEKAPARKAELMINRGDLYFLFFRYEDALRLYCKALFAAKPSFKKENQEYQADEGEVDLRHIVSDYRLQENPEGVPRVPETLFRIGFCYERLGKWREAIMVYDAFGELFPSHPLKDSANRNAQNLRLRRM
jgi:tetratricopeptide (TPR) repeat protein